MSKKRKNEIARGKHAGVPISDLDKELIFQTYALTGNKRKTAKALGLSERTVYRYLKKLDSEDFSTRRVAVVQDLQSRTQAKAYEVLESIGPSDFAKASLPQKGITYGILVDKLKSLSDLETQLSANESPTDQLQPPADINALMGAIKKKISSIKMLDIRFEKDNPELVQDIATTLQNAEILADAEVISVDEFDPKG